MSNIEQLTRPLKVSIAVNMVYLTILLGVARLILEPEWMNSQIPFGALLTIQSLSVAIVGLVVFMIGRGKHWARIVFLILFIPGLPFSIMPLIQSLSDHPFSGMLGVLQTAGQIVAVALLFHRESSAWFREIQSGRHYTPDNHTPDDTSKSAGSADA